MDLQLLGINHHTAALELRGGQAVDGAGGAAMLRDIDSTGHSSRVDRGTS